MEIKQNLALFTNRGKAKEVIGPIEFYFRFAPEPILVLQFQNGNLFMFTKQLEEPHINSLDFILKANYGIRGWKEAISTASTEENNKTKVMPHPRKYCRNECHIQGKNNTGDNCNHISSHLIYLACMEDRKILNNMVYDVKVNCVVTPVAAAIPDVDLLVE